jgi:nicotinamidase-related amidase
MTLAEKSKTFLDYIETWLAALPLLTLDEALPNPEKSAIISVDVINGFLYEGALASPRVAAIDVPITNLMKEAWERGLRDILLVQDAHDEGTMEFKEFGPHALKGSVEAETIDLIKELPFFDQITIFNKDSIHPALNTSFDAWLGEREDLETIVAVGDVTDLCLYQLAMYLKLRANAYRRNWRVIVPENCTQTWHLSVEDAQNLPAKPHHGDLLHATFLNHMALNGIEVVKGIEIS